LENLGFTIEAESPLGFSVSGNRQAFEELTGGTVVAKELLTRAEGGRTRYVTHLDIVGDGQPEALGVAKAEPAKIDAISLDPPKIAMAVFPSPIAPNSGKFHLRVPNDVAMVLGASEVHQQGINGEGVVVAMPDSGWYRHPYFTAQNYAVKTPIAVVSGTSPSVDPYGHGTGESANLFATAPGAVLQPIRASDDQGNLPGAQSAFMKAKELNPSIITNSWGGEYTSYPPAPASPNLRDKLFAPEIMDAIERGILVVFSAGNGQFAMEPQVPGVLAAGGVYMGEGAGMLRASDYASGYQSSWFDGVRVPTVCGLVGFRPRAQYIMLPIPPGCTLDLKESQPQAPPLPPDSGDGTAPNDGWALFSGTSAAAPQLAGVAALILSAKQGLKPAQLIEAMSNTAIDIVTGCCHPRFNNCAAAGHDLATGYGLVNAAAAVNYAREKF
jgi:subtilisin family serine protease